MNANGTKLLILIQHHFEQWRAPAWFADKLRSTFPGLEVVHRDNYAGAEADLSDAEVMITSSLTSAQYAHTKKLRWIHSPAAAVHRLLVPELVASDVVVTSSRSVHGPVVAEHVIALVLAVAKRLPLAMKYQREKRWGQELLWKANPRPQEIAGATLGLVGMGSIGSEVVRLASVLGMNAVAVRSNPSATKEAHERNGASIHATYGPEQLENMLQVADYVVLAAPVTPRTVGMMNAQRFAAMKRDGYLINVSRGALVDEPALISALREQKIAGAALDVFEQEPLPEDSPLWEIENLLITPHSAGLTGKLWDRHFELVSENLRRYLTGLSLLGLVDKSRGY